MASSDNMLSQSLNAVWVSSTPCLSKISSATSLSLGTVFRSRSVASSIVEEFCMMRTQPSAAR
eukprot:5666769-Prorocentrum_lima.AAC.1